MSTRLCSTCGSPLTESIASVCPRCALVNALALGTATAPPVGGGGSHTTIPGYAPLYELGRGSMGVVWLARDLALDRLVALKLITAGGDPQSRARLLREARAIAQLHHSHIVAVHTLGDAGETAYLAMDFMEGGDLQAHLQNKPLAPGATAVLIRHVADALAYAHAAGVLHRDLKPSNILLDADGAPQLADFGLAAPLAGAGDLTMPGHVAGTPGFLAPELMAGSDRASIRSDLYGLGAVLYVCLTGRAPFVGESTAAVLAQLLASEPPAPRLLNPAVPRDLETICLKALEKSPERRYVSAVALRDDVDRFLRGKPITAVRIRWWQKSLRWCRRKPALAAATGVATVLLLFLAVGGPFVAWSMARARAAAESARHEAVNAVAETREQLREALLARSRATRLSGRQGQRTEALAAAEAAARLRPGLDARNEVIAALALSDVFIAKEWTLRTSPRQRVTFDPDHGRYALVADDGSIALNRLGDGALLQALHARGAVSVAGPTFSLDGKRVVMRDANARVLAWRDNQVEPTFVLEGRRYLLAGGVAGYGSPDGFSPDGETLASAMETGVSFHASTDGAEQGRIATEAEPSHVLYSPDGRWIAVGRGLRGRGGVTAVFIRVFDGVSFKEVTRLPITNPFQTLAWAPDSATLLVGGQLLEVFDVRSGRRIRLISDPRATRGLFGSDSTLISANQSGGITVWDSATARPMLSAALGSQPEIAVDRTGVTIAKAMATQARLYSLEHSAVVRSIPSQALEGYDNVTNNGGSAIDYSHDGRWIATAIWGGLQLRNASTGRVVAAAAVGTTNNHTGVRFSSDDTSLLSGSRELGVTRWPIERAMDGGVRLGPPVTIDGEPDFVLADLSRDGRRALLVSMWHGEVKVVALDDATTTAVRWLLPGVGRAVFLAADREVLANSTDAMGVAALVVRAADTGREVRALPYTHGYHVRTSHDGRWTIAGTSASTATLIKSQDGNAGPTLPAEWQGAGKNAALSHDGAWLAVAAGSQIGIVRTADGTLVAQLETARSGSYAPDVAFSPDASQLSVFWENGLFTLWDLASLRRELAARGLDW